MADYLDRFVNQQEAEFMKQMRRVYGQAAREVQQKLDAFIKRHKEKSRRLLLQVAAGEITENDYKRWLSGQVFIGKQWRDRLGTITDIYVDADKKSRGILNAVTKGIFAEAANYTAYEIERDYNGAISFNLYDKTIERLIKRNPKVLPEWKIDEPKDYIWNEKRVQNAVLQGIIQGESITDIAKRLTVGLATDNAKKMNLFARTAMTGAQNAGRVERMGEADREFGIKSKKRWLSAHDNKVRDAHKELDGKTVDYDKPFIIDGDKIDYPGDPFAKPALVFNCRCTLLYVHGHMTGDYSVESHTLPEYESYSRWKEKKNEG